MRSVFACVVTVALLSLGACGLVGQRGEQERTVGGGTTSPTPTSATSTPRPPDPDLPDHPRCDDVLDEGPLPPSTASPSEVEAVGAAAEELGRELGVGPDAAVQGVGTHRDAEGFHIMVYAKKLEPQMPTEYQGHRVRYCRGGPFGGEQGA